MSWLSLSVVCRYPEETLTPKFHIMIYEHQRLMKKYGMCGMTTEEFIEVLHRDENEHFRLVRHMQNPTKRWPSNCAEPVGAR